VGTLGESLSDPFRGSLKPSGRLLICRVVELLLELLSTTLSRVLDSLPPSGTYDPSHSPSHRLGFFMRRWCALFWRRPRVLRSP